MKPIIKYEFIECVIPANFSGTRVTFADQPQLRFVAMQGLECYNVVTCSSSILSGNPVLDATNTAKGFLVLYYDDRESTKYIPLSLLNPVATNTTATNYPSVFGVKTFNGQQVQWSKSYIQFSTAPTGITVNTSVVFGVYYS
jgi:hypothetical protein